MTTPALPAHRPFAVVIAIACALWLGGCGGDAPKPAAPAQPQEATAQIGDASVRASLVRTDVLNEAVAKRYGIARSENTVLLLVGVRRGGAGSEVAVPARIRATVARLPQPPTPLTLREQRAGEWLDYVGTVEIDPPETVQFALDVSLEDGGSTTLRFSRDFRDE
jgi:hypothetical protein